MHPTIMNNLSKQFNVNHCMDGMCNNTKCNTKLLQCYMYNMNTH